MSWRRVLRVIKGSRKKGEGKRGKGLTLGRFYATMEKKVRKERTTWASGHYQINDQSVPFASGDNSNKES